MREGGGGGWVLGRKPGPAGGVWREVLKKLPEFVASNDYFYILYGQAFPQDIYIFLTQGYRTRQKSSHRECNLRCVSLVSVRANKYSYEFTGYMPLIVALRFMS